MDKEELSWELRKYARRGGVEAATSLLDDGAELEACDWLGWKPLHFTANHNQLELAKLFTERGAVVDALTEGHDTPLNLAAYQDHPELCLFFISKGVDPGCKNRNGKSALTHYGEALEDPALNVTARPLLTADQKKERVAALLAARENHLIEMERLRKEECWQRRKDALQFLVGCKFRPTAAEREELRILQIKIDKRVPLPAVSRKTPSENRQYLQQEVFGHEGLSRKIVGFM
jgi:hypothetical protein